jgi:hypothetical protein
MVLPPSMVIDKIHVKSVSAFKAENDPPIRVDSYREKAFQLSLKDVQTEDRQIHAFNLLRGVQGRENESDPRQHIRRQFAAIVILEKTPQSFVSKVLYHQNLL